MSLRCPEISKIESHPFTITSTPSASDPAYTVHFKLLGDWTSKFGCFIYVELNSNTFKCDNIVSIKHLMIMIPE